MNMAEFLSEENVRKVMRAFAHEVLNPEFDIASFADGSFKKTIYDKYFFIFQSTAMSDRDSLKYGNIKTIFADWCEKVFIGCCHIVLNTWRHPQREEWFSIQEITDDPHPFEYMNKNMYKFLYNDFSAIRQPLTAEEIAGRIAALMKGSASKNFILAREQFIKITEDVFYLYFNTKQCKRLIGILKSAGISIASAGISYQFVNTSDPGGVAESVPDRIEESVIDGVCAGK